MFDMDGVLVDVSESYREAICATVEHFTGATVTQDVIQDFKNQGGYNDDWALSYRLIRDAGIEVGYDTVVDRFQRYFRGDDERAGFIEREKWIAEDGLFDRLRERYRLAIFTGRLHEEADVTLSRFAPRLFDPVVGTDDVQAGKPAPDGLLKIRSMVPHDRLFYLGDTVDDAQSAAAAQVPFLGVAGLKTPRRPETVAALEASGAMAVMTSINELPEILRSL